MWKKHSSTLEINYFFLSLLTLMILLCSYLNDRTQQPCFDIIGLMVFITRLYHPFVWGYKKTSLSKITNKHDLLKDPRQ